MEPQVPERGSNVEHQAEVEISAGARGNKCNLTRVKEPQEHHISRPSALHGGFNPHTRLRWDLWEEKSSSLLLAIAPKHIRSKQQSASPPALESPTGTRINATD